MPRPKDAAVMPMVGRKILGNDVALKVVQWMHVAGARPLTVDGFGGPLIVQNRSLALGDEHAVFIHRGVKPTLLRDDRGEVYVLYEEDVDDETGSVYFCTTRTRELANVGAWRTYR